MQAIFNSNLVQASSSETSKLTVSKDIWVFDYILCSFVFPYATYCLDPGKMPKEGATEYCRVKGIHQWHYLSHD